MRQRDRFILGLPSATVLTVLACQLYFAPFICTLRQLPVSGSTINNLVLFNIVLVFILFGDLAFLAYKFSRGVKTRNA